MAAGESVLGTIEHTESLILVGGTLLFAYWFLTSDATKALRDKLANLAPVGVSQVNQIPGTSNKVGGATIGTTLNGESYSVASGSKAITIMGVDGVPQTYGPSYPIPTLDGQTVTDLRNLGYSDSDIVGMIAADNAAAPAGGASGSF